MSKSGSMSIVCDSFSIGKKGKENKQAQNKYSGNLEKNFWSHL